MKVSLVSDAQRHTYRKAKYEFGLYSDCDCDCGYAPGNLDIPPLVFPVIYSLELTPVCNNNCPGCGNVFVDHKGSRAKFSCQRPMLVDDWEIILAKSAATLTLSLTLAGLLGLSLLSADYGMSLGSFALLASTVVLYATLLMFFAVSFENQGFVLVPFYVAVLVMLILDSDIGTLQLNFRLSDWIPAIIAASLSLSLLFLALTLLVMRTKELDL